MSEYNEIDKGTIVAVHNRSEKICYVTTYLNIEAISIIARL